MAQRCSFCEEQANTDEHVIPRWLQRHYDLKDQHLGLWNGTPIRYSQARIPACRRCNSDILGQLEQDVRHSRARPRDYYLWALKIRYGLAIRDATLLYDRRRPERGPLISMDEAKRDEAFVIHALRALEEPTFRFDPDPFGSVFLFGNAEEAENFDLIDVPPPYRALAVSLPGKRVLAILFADRGVVKRRLLYRCRGNRKRVRRLFPELRPRSILFNLLIWQTEYVIPDAVRLEADGIVSAPVPSKPPLRRMRRTYLRDIASFCGFPPELGDLAFARIPASRKRLD